MIYTTFHNRTVAAICPMLAVSEEEGIQNEESIGTKKRISKRSCKRSVLLVEDNPIIQLVNTAILEALGYAVTLAKDGEEALAIFKADCYDVIVMDIGLPIIDGITATRQIREIEQNKGTRTPLLILTANGEADRAKSLAAGADDYAIKPLLKDELCSRLEKLIKLKIM